MGSFSNVLALILTGDLDTVGPLADNRRVAARFPNRRSATVANAGHHTAFNSPVGCSAAVVQRSSRRSTRATSAAR